jgi:hypothetical protein
MNAVISDCGRYRYRLDRDCGAGKLVIAYFGVNPSTADASIDDATVRKWRGFSTRLGASRFIVGNVFAYRATDVHELARCADAIGPLNRHYLYEIAAEADVLIPCWGSRDKLPKQLRHAFDMTMSDLIAAGKPVKVFGRSKSGDPLHPLMLGYNTTINEWKDAA